MSHEYDIIRSGRDYELRKRDEESSIWTLVDKRTNHCWHFTSVVPNGFQNTVFLRKLSSREREILEDPRATTGNRTAILDKESLPEWLLDELRHIREHGTVRPPTDPRGDDDD